MRPRPWIVIFIVVQIVGFAFDAVWHGYLRPEFEARTVGEMLIHLSTVHLPLYVGVVGLLVSTVWAVVEQARRGRIGLALPLALAGAAIQTAGEAWHAYTHLRLSPSGALPAMIAFSGLVIALAALLLERLRARRRTAKDEARRRHAA